MFGQKEPPKKETGIKRGGFGVTKKPIPPPKPVSDPFKKIKVNCVFSDCRGKVENKENSKGSRFAICGKCKQVYRYMPRNMKPKIWYESFGPKPI